MKYDFYNDVSDARRRRIVAAQQILYARVLRGIVFTSALEIGPGHGGFAEYCRRRGIAYQAVEVNPTLAERLRHRGFRIQVAEAADAVIGEASVDLIMLSHVVEHLGSYQEVSRILDRLAGGLSHDGWLTLLFPDVGWSLGHFFGDYTHTFPTTLRSIEKLCTDIGLMDVRGGHYVGRWTRGWTPLWLLHRGLPTWLLPRPWAEGLADRFAVHAYCIARRRPR